MAISLTNGTTPVFSVYALRLVPLRFILRVSARSFEVVRMQSFMSADIIGSELSIAQSATP